MVRSGLSAVGVRKKGFVAPARSITIVVHYQEYGTPQILDDLICIDQTLLVGYAHATMLMQLGTKVFFVLILDNLCTS